MMFRASGLSTKIQWRTSRIPERPDETFLYLSEDTFYQLDLWHSNNVFLQISTKWKNCVSHNTWWRLQSFQFADQPVQFAGKLGTVGPVSTDQRSWRKYKSLLGFLKILTRFSKIFHHLGSIGDEQLWSQVLCAFLRVKGNTPRAPFCYDGDIKKSPYYFAVSFFTISIQGHWTDNARETV